MIGYVPDTVFFLKIEDRYCTDHNVIRVFMQEGYAELFRARFKRAPEMRVVEAQLRDVMATARAMGDVTLMLSHCHPRRLVDAEVLVDPESALH